MNQRTRNTAIASAIALFLAASAAQARDNGDIHAYFEGQRTITDGQTVPVAPVAAAARSGVAPAVAGSEGQFLLELSRTDGSAEPVPMLEATADAWHLERQHAAR